MKVRPCAKIPVAFAVRRPLPCLAPGWNDPSGDGSEPQRIVIMPDPGPALLRADKLHCCV